MIYYDNITRQIAWRVARTVVKPMPCYMPHYMRHVDDPRRSLRQAFAELREDVGAGGPWADGIRETDCLWMPDMCMCIWEEAHT